MNAIDVEGLTTEERAVVARFVALLRESREKRAARGDLARLWKQYAALPGTLDQVEADALALEAVRVVRSRSA